MTSFLIALAVLIGGYFVYGSIVERILKTDPSREVPANRLRDNVDYMPMPTWKVFLIQFLNIAGLGPIFGAIMGVTFGPAAFLWIVLGTIFAGGVHDLVSGYVSLRSDGASLPEIVGQQLGLPVRQVMRIFSVVLLLLVTAVFAFTPAQLIASLTPEALNADFWLIVIFGYYILATILPIDKVIGKFYPLFGFALLFMAVGIMAVMMFSPDVNLNINFLDAATNHSADPSLRPIFPMMFVSIACGAISGFHATQSPMMARCLKNERLARPVFYGAMVAEGIVALIWAAAAIAFTGGYENVSDYMATHSGGAGTLVSDISITWLGTFGGILAILGVVAAPITTGDTALRSARLIVADFMHVNQVKLPKRLLVAIPLCVIVAFLMMIDFNVLWRYFAWSNQTLAVFTLWAVTVYLARHRANYLITLIPAMFMTMVSVSYLLVAPSPEGFGLPVTLSICISAGVAIALTALFASKVKSLSASAALPRPEASR